jgi:uncharacterized protein (DUF1810 family)
MAQDPFDLRRFVTAQDAVLDDVLAELRAGRKRSHWMWFVFPQLAALGFSPMARHYGLRSLAEARAYLAHPVLGERLRRCCGLLLQLEGVSASEVFGHPDDLKLRSCLTLFQLAAPHEDVFRDCLARFYGGQPDASTVDLCKEAVGKVQEKTGQVTGSTEQQVKGIAKQVEGQTQKAVGDVKEVLKDAGRK